MKMHAEKHHLGYRLSEDPHAHAGGGVHGQAAGKHQCFG